MTLKAVILLMSLLALSAAGCSGKKAADAHVEAGHHGEHGHGEEGDACGDHEGEGPKTLSVSEGSRATMGLKLASVGYRVIEETLPVTGETAKDTDRTYHVLARAQGTVSDIRVRYGDAVQSGSVLATVHDTRTGTTEEVRSGHDGIVTGVNVAPGQRIDDLASLFTISDISSLYATFDIYEKDAGKVRVGQRIAVTSVAYPGTAFAGKIVFISPRIDDASRTVKARAELDNRGFLLKHGMFLEGKIILSGGRHLAVPLKAVQRSGDRKLVFVSKGTSGFEAREVETGFEDDAYAQVKRGLRAGENVAVDGSFLLKSELLKSRMGDGCAE